MSEYAFTHQRRPQKTHPAVELNVLPVHRKCLSLQSPLYILQAARFRMRRKHPLHSFDRPEKVDRRGPSRSKQITDIKKFAFELCGILSVDLFGSQGNSHRGCHADSGSTSNDHFLDCLSNLL